MYSKKVMEHFQKPHNMGEMNNPDGIGTVGNPVCLVPKSMIHTNPDIKTIRDIEPKNRVLSHNGLYNDVSKVLKREYIGEILSIKNRLGVTHLTPEHEVFSIKVPKTHHFLYLKYRKTLKPSWYHAFELEKGDMALYPILKEVKDVKEIDTETKKKAWDFRSKEIPKKIPLSEDFLRLCGYYLAEGYLKEKVTKTYVGFTFSIDEEEYVTDVMNIIMRVFGITAKKKNISSHNTIQITVNNVFITRLFSGLFGKGAAEKSIPQFMMLLDAEKQKSLIKGLWRGDGFVNKKIPRAGYSTISYKLHQQVKTLLLRQKIIPSAYVEEEKNVKGVNHKKAYRIHVGGRDSIKKLLCILDVPVKINKKASNDAWVDDDFVYIPITDISKKHYSGLVYNLSVANAHTYVTDSLAVHNCGDMMKIFIKVKNNKIADIKFQTYGCAAAIATSSMITDLAKGKTLEEAEKISRKNVSDALEGLPPIKEHCSNLAADGLRAAIEDYRKKIH